MGKDTQSETGGKDAECEEYGFTSPEQLEAAIDTAYVEMRQASGELKTLETVELSTEQNYNMIDGLLNNGPALPPQPPEKELDKVKEPPNKRRSREREER